MSRFETKRPRVLIDCDCVIADTNKDIVDFINERTGHSYTPDMVREWDVFKALGHPELDKPWRIACHEEQRCLKLLPYVGAPRFVHEVKKVADLFVVTAPLGGCPTWHSQREEWLEKNFGIDRHNVIFASAKEVISGDVFIDDKFSNVVKWKQAHPGHGDALVFDQPWNQRDYHFYVSGRVKTYEDCMSAIMEWV